jgi:hypothetical protein
MSSEETTRWLLALVQLPSTAPPKHRVAVWRELRKIGAVPMTAGGWVVPDSPAFEHGLKRAEELCRRGAGTFALIDAVPRNSAAADVFRTAFVAARLDEWSEFEAECGKYEQEIANEISKRKFTFGELEEEEQSLERLRRWYRDLKRRDALELPEAGAAEAHLRLCEGVFDGYADRVYAVMRGSGPASVEPDPAE